MPIYGFYASSQSQTELAKSEQNLLVEILLYLYSSILNSSTIFDHPTRRDERFGGRDGSAVFAVDLAAQCSIRTTNLSFRVAVKPRGRAEPSAY